MIIKKILTNIFFALFFCHFAQLDSAWSKNNSARKNSEKINSQQKNLSQCCNSGFADIIESVLPSVVSISAIQNNDNLDKQIFSELAPNQIEDLRENNDLSKPFGKKKFSSIGSGVIISKDGFIITNSHVVENSQEIKISLNDDSKYQAKVIGIDKLTDLALIKIDAKKDLKAVKFGDSTKARIGDWVIVVGNPFGLGGSVSIGIISARSRDINNGQIDDFIQTDAAINKGNSGGPLFNLAGEVIGISTAIFSPSGGNVGIGFATPSATVIEVAQQLKEKGEVSRGWLGVSIVEVSDEIAKNNQMEKTFGALVSEVEPSSPAENSLIMPTDIIIKFDNQEISDVKTLPKIVAKSEIGKIYDLELIRAGKLKKVKIKVGKMNLENDSEKKSTEAKNDNKKKFDKPNIGEQKIIAKKNFFGIILSEISQNDKKLIVSSITKNAKNKDLKINDLIISANQKKIDNFNDLVEVINQAKQNGKKIFLLIKRGDRNIVSIVEF